MQSASSPQALEAMLQELGIPADYAKDRQLSFHPEAFDLVGVGLDIYGRAQQLSLKTAEAWESMRAAAAGDGIVLQLVSGFRSIDYQASIVRRKLSKGLHIQEILRSSAAPGYSEHHTGRAIDITTPGSEPLEEQFERTTAFVWLECHANRYNFRMSYPRGNPHGVVFEPWHWMHASVGPKF